MDVAEQGWSNPETARAYAAFTRAHDMYRHTSLDLVIAAAIGVDDQVVVDLACGTGSTCEQILDVLADSGRLIAVDASAAMLTEARRAIADPRVEWAERRAEELSEVIDAGRVDAVVCNSAIWQSDMAATFAGVRRVLRPGGRFAFNIGRQFIVMPFSDDELNPTGPRLWELLEAYAVIDHGHVPSRPARRGGPPLTVERVTALVEEAGLVLRVSEEREYADTLERQRDWLSIPVFTEHTLPGLTYDQRMEALAKAYERADKHLMQPPARWMLFVAQRPAEKS